MVDLKKIEQKDIPYALERADRYRQMNEPLAAESICLDVLRIEPKHQEALVNLLLAMSEQFKDQIFPAYDRALEVLARMDNDYQKVYYKGIIFERRAKAHMNKKGFGTGRVAYEWFQKAMAAYDQAISIRPEGNPDSILRWNTCARIIMDDKEVKPSSEYSREKMLE